MIHTESIPINDLRSCFRVNETLLKKLECDTARPTYLSINHALFDYVRNNGGRGTVDGLVTKYSGRIDFREGFWECCLRAKPVKHIEITPTDKAYNLSETFKEELKAELGLG